MTTQDKREFLNQHYTQVETNKHIILTMIQGEFGGEYANEEDFKQYIIDLVGDMANVEDDNILVAYVDWDRVYKDYSMDYDLVEPSKGELLDTSYVEDYIINEIYSHLFEEPTNE